MKLRAMLVGSVLSLTFASTAIAAPIAIAGTEGLPVIVTGTGDVVATYLGTTAAYSNDLYLAFTASGPGIDPNNANDPFIFNNHASPVNSTVNLGSFAVGTELVFRLFVNNTGNTFFSGLASRNPDGLAHARVQANWMTVGTTLVSFEDLLNNPEGASGFNDLSFSFTNTSNVPSAVPEPASMLLLGTGLAGLVARRRRLNKNVA